MYKNIWERMRRLITHLGVGLGENVKLRKKFVIDISFYFWIGWLLNHKHNHSLRIGDGKKNQEKNRRGKARKREWGKNYKYRYRFVSYKWCNYFVNEKEKVEGKTTSFHCQLPSKPKSLKEYSYNVFNE